MHDATRSLLARTRALARALPIAALAVTAHAGCGDDGAPGDEPDMPDSGVPAPPDAPPAVPVDVAHLPASAWFGSDALLVWSGDGLVDTTALRVDGASGQGWVLDTWAQTPEGPELAVLHVTELIVAVGATVRVVGERPLVVVASDRISVRGRIDAGGRGPEPGAGGAGPGQGPGAGQPGLHNQTMDSGGGGAGHRERGARGGHACDPGVPAATSCTAPTSPSGGPGGSAYGDEAAQVLAGGSGGGTGGTGGDDGCPGGPGGAGGGAVQLYAARSIEITPTGGIDAGGGGGRGGLSAGCPSSAGGGGGSGGVIYLQAPVIEHLGRIAANGGGGGAGASAGVDGAAGSDGLLESDPAPGGSLDAGGEVMDNGSSPGGHGGTGDTPPAQGVDEPRETNAGGGGGAAGRVVLECRAVMARGLISPAAHRTPGCAAL